ncbi:MAG: hypothetical protein JWN04_3588 [Myxococcaceae bacterium]|nr:hypothetical protein [Myxococcaceae bacterium]
MAKQTSSRSSSTTSKRKASEAPAPITQVVPAPAKQAAASRPPASAVAPSHEQIAQRAYELYRTRPDSDGNEVSDWLRAERDLRV